MQEIKVCPELLEIREPLVRWAALVFLEAKDREVIQEPRDPMVDWGLQVNQDRPGRKEPRGMLDRLDPRDRQVQEVIQEVREHQVLKDHLVHQGQEAVQDSLGLQGK